MPSALRAAASVRKGGSSSAPFSFSGGPSSPHVGGERRSPRNTPARRAPEIVENGHSPREEAVMPVETSERSDLANELLEQIGRTVGQRAQASAVFGEPVQRDGLTVIPVAKARFGFGGGGGSGPEGEGGSGGGGGGGGAV